MSLRLAVEGSLRRLRRDRIDLVYQHRQDPAVPIEDAIGTLAKLRSEGKIGKVGLSAIDGTTLARASVIVKIAAVQNEYSLLHRESGKEILGEIESSSTAFVAYSPLARGLLSETARGWTEQAPDDYRRQDVRFSPERLAIIRAATKSLHKIAAERQVAVPVIALSWLLSKSPNLAVLPGCKSLAQVSVVVEATKLSLCADEIDLLDGLAVEGPKD
jgi:aryl-alcohol dehydrogenase-like predicted oxidoreductase